MGSVKSKRGIPSVYLMVLLVFASMFSILLPAKDSQALDPEISFVRNLSLSTPDDLEFSPVSMAIDSDGNFYVINSFTCQIKKISPAEELITSWGSCGSGDGQFNAPQDIAIDSQDNVYVLDLNNYRIQKFSSDGTFLLKWGSNGSGDGQFTNMRRLLVDHSDNIFVSADNRIQKFSSGGTFLTKWGTLGSGDGQFWNAEKMAVDSSDNIYVVDKANYRIQKFSNAGTFLLKWGSNGTGDGQFSGVQAIAIDSDDTIYVADFSTSGRVQTFTTAGVYTSKWGSLGEGDGQYYSAWHIQPDNDGNLFIVDVTQGRIQKVTTGGVYVSRLGQFGGGTPNPFGVASDPGGNVYIADRDNFQVQKRNEAGAYLSKLYANHPNSHGPTDVTVGPDGKIYAVYSFRNIVEVYSSNYQLLMTLGTYTGSAIGSSADGSFNDPKGVGIDSQGNVYVTDRGNLRVQKFNSSGDFVKKWGSNGSGAGQFSTGGGFEGPQGIAVDGEDNIYVADPGNNRVQKFNSNGLYLGRFDGPQYAWPIDALARGTMILPGIDSSGNRYIPDTANQQIVKIDPEGNELQRWGGSGSGTGQLSLIADSYTRVIVYQNEVYIADTANYRVQVFTLNGSFVRQWGTAGAGEGQFSYVTDIMVDSDGRLQVADLGNARIQTFLPDGTFVDQWAIGSVEDPATMPLFVLQDSVGSGDYYVGTMAGTVVQYDKDTKLSQGTVINNLFSSIAGSDPGWLDTPRDVAVDDEGYVYIADTDNNRIQVFTPDGHYVTSWGTSGTGDGEFSGPQSVAIGLNNQVWVADVGNKRVEQFTVSLPPLVVTPDPDPDPTPNPDPTPSAGDTPTTSPTVAPNGWVPSGLASSETPSLPSDTSIVLTVQPNTIFDENRPLLTGYTIPFGWVEVTVYSAPQTGKVQADAIGFWQWQPPEPLEPGSHRYEARLVHADGTYGKTTDAVAFTIAGPHSSTPEIEDEVTPPATENDTASTGWLKKVTIGSVSLVALLLILWIARRVTTR